MLFITDIGLSAHLCSWSIFFVTFTFPASPLCHFICLCPSECCLLSRIYSLCSILIPLSLCLSSIYHLKIVLRFSRGQPHKQYSAIAIALPHFLRYRILLLVINSYSYCSGPKGKYIAKGMQGPLSVLIVIAVNIIRKCSKIVGIVQSRYRIQRAGQPKHDSKDRTARTRTTRMRQPW